MVGDEQQPAGEPFAFGDELPAWSQTATALADGLARAAPSGLDRDWAFGGATGAGVRVAILDSGIPRQRIGNTWLSSRRRKLCTTR